MKALGSVLYEQGLTFPTGMTNVERIKAVLLDPANVFPH